MYSRISGLANPWLDKCLKSLIFEDPPKSNMVNGHKNC